jgi:hypothetical protein
MKYVDLLCALEILARYYPKYQSQEFFILADDILKWLNNELPEDSSAFCYLTDAFGSPAEALRAVWKEIQLLALPFLNVN